MSSETQPAGSGGYIRAGDLRVFYREQGSGPPLVLLHGGLATSENMWGGRVDELARKFHVYAPDTRSHGRTDNPAGRLSYQQLADDVAAFLDALELEDTLIVGYSDGAQIAIELGLRHARRARALVLGGAVTSPSEKYLETVRAMGFAQPGKVDFQQMEQDFGDYFEELKTLHQHAYGPEHWRELVMQISELWLSVPSYTDEQLAAITAPTLAITGDRDEGDSLDHSLRLYRLLPRAELAVIPNAGHGAGDTQLFWQAVEEFLLRH